MRKAADYAAPSYHDPNDRRLVQIVRRAVRPQPRAVNVLGIPFDGAVLGRKGAAGGPAGIRQAMVGFSNYNPELGVGIEHARVFDLGDVVLAKGEGVLEAHSEIESEVASSLAPSSLLVLLGGDNSVSLPALRASGRKLGKLGLIVVDSHLDLRGKIKGKPTNGSSYGLAIEAVPSLDPRRVVEVGAHGFLNSRRYFDRAKKQGISVHTAQDVRMEGAESIAKEAYERASRGADAVYLSVDMDAVDLGQVSGVSAPSAGGLSSSELLGFVYEVTRKERVAAADIVELAPNLDPTGGSQRVAATVLTYLIAGFNSRK
ncbi:MAG: agmatinase family protein [Nitrososphaerota archaeon]|nr:agmatinase family protein [Nitrososphaerota archaeon]